MGFRQATFYLAELFRQATFYLAELFRQITSPLKKSDMSSQCDNQIYKPTTLTFGLSGCFCTKVFRQFLRIHRAGDPPPLSPQKLQIECIFKSGFSKHLVKLTHYVTNASIVAQALTCLPLPNLTSLWKLQYTNARTNVTHASIVAHAT